jgi:hypothetical protein
MGDQIHRQRPDRPASGEDHRRGRNAGNSDENSPFIYQDDIDPAEVAGFSNHKF